MSTLKHNNQLALSDALTAKTNLLCIGLEEGDAEILDLVTPTTAELLKWWFSQEMMDSRGGFNFHIGQKQAILNTIVAHEILRAPSLKDLYERTCPYELLESKRLAEVAQDKHNHPKYALKMATGTGKTWVMQALMVWQLLNKNVLINEGVEDEELHQLFTRHFMIVAPGLIVYDRLLDAFCGKLIAGREDERDFNTSDIVKNAELFVPEMQREAVFNFVRGNVCIKSEIGLKTTGNGMIAITNWHLLTDGDVEFPEEDEDELLTMGADLDPALVMKQILPLTPGRAAGNALDMLDKRYARGNVLDYLANLPELMVFNDEAHHIHAIKKEGEATEVEWQKSLTRIAQRKASRFVQVDFSATPYNDVGGGKNKRKVYFPHIITDFDLKTAMAAGLVKSLVLDKRVEIGATALADLDFTAERDESGKLAIALSEGQRVMLRAGLVKLRKLEADFAKLDANRPPKMLVVCEDTSVSPLVVDFLQQEGLSEDEVLSVDSGKKAELGAKDWAPVRERLFSVDQHATPRVIVSVLMLREGFDVNNICVIVPLRASKAQILLEQTIGRGLRLMWRDDEYTDAKRENRALLQKGQKPSSMIDVLTIVEHPAFSAFYDDLIAEGLAAEDEGDDDGMGSIGDMIKVGLRENYADYDFHIPFIISETEEHTSHRPIDVAQLRAFSLMSMARLKEMLGSGDSFISHDLLSTTLFGAYRVDGAVMNVSGYNDYLSRMGKRISQALQTELPKGNKIANHVPHPYQHTSGHEMIAALDEYVRFYLFACEFEPMVDENWRLLLLQPVFDHVVEKFALALYESEEKTSVGESVVTYRSLSEVDSLIVRESYSLETPKCIYERLAYPSNSGGLEKAFIEWAQKDSGVDAYCKISENRHTFVRLRYLKHDGLPAFYHPDFLVRAGDVIYLVETKAQAQVAHPNVQRKQQAALNWCNRINELPLELRQNLTWHYVLLGEAAFYEWRDRNDTLVKLLDFVRIYKMQQVEQALF